MRLDGESVTCPSCEWTMSRSAGVLSDSVTPLAGSFDDKFEVLDAHNHHHVVWDLCYRRQCALIGEAIGSRLAATPGSRPVVLDIGCGPNLPYDRPEGAYIVGVEPSLPALRANKGVDLALHTSASTLPLADGTVDVALALYAIHHMIGPSVHDSWLRVESAFDEMARVTKPGAVVVVLEVCPWPPVWMLERIGWKGIRRMLGDGVDFVFWPEKKLVRAGGDAFPGASLTRERFSVSPFATFPPVIAAPKFTIPRVLYPFSVCTLTWNLPK
jgi:SAM-dependent methyltransferase